MRPIIIDRVTRIPLEHVRSPISVLQKLTLANGAYFSKPATKKKGKQREIPQYFNLAEQEDDYLLVPRAWNPQSYLTRKSTPVVAHAFDPDNWHRVQLGTCTPDLGPNKHIRYDQGPAWKALSAPQTWPYGRILALGCGKGKTVLGLKLAQERAVPTIVVCHTIQMMYAWAKTARDLFGVKEEQIGYIGDGKLTWDDRDIVFTTMAGLIAREYPDDFWTGFGLVLFDEGDLLGAAELSRILPLFLGERVLLTATVKRADGNDQLYYHHVGPICFEDVEPDLQPSCYILDSPVPSHDAERGKMEKTAWNPMKGGMAPHVPRTINNLCTYPPRQDWAFGVVKDLLAQHRKILFLGERVDELARLNQRSQQELKGFKTGLALGSGRMKAADVEKNLRECDVVWAIQQIAKRGLNEPSFDTLVIQYATFTDEGRLRQTIGRVLRYMQDKLEPLVVILNDPAIGCLNNKTVRLGRKLQKWGYSVEWYGYEEAA